jgi:protein-L-isoaspartate O-methyltransferase
MRLVRRIGQRWERPERRHKRLDDRLVIPVGGRYGQYLERWRRKGEKYDLETITPVAFVPLEGKEGGEA